MRKFKLAATLALGITAVALSGCATGFSSKVSRYQLMPAPQGQSFIVLPAQTRDVGGLEFSRYSALVNQAMQAQGYIPASSVAQATMLVLVDYGVDEGTTEYDSYGGYGGWGYGGFGGLGYGYGGYGGYGGFGRYGRGWGGYGGYGWGGWGGYGPSFGLDSYTVYNSFLDLQIRRKGDNASLFEGRAQARSRNDNLAYIVPNLVTAMFTGFPGQSGETVRITIPPPQRAR